MSWGLLAGLMAGPILIGLLALPFAFPVGSPNRRRIVAVYDSVFSLIGTLGTIALWATGGMLLLYAVVGTMTLTMKIETLEAACGDLNPEIDPTMECDAGETP